MKKIVLSLVLAVFLQGCIEKLDWEIALKTNKSGDVVHGSKKSLINAIRNGSKIRIGWGSKGKTVSIEHLSDPIWLAILNEKEVIAHLDPQHLSTINWDSLNASYNSREKLANEWRVAINTNGEFNAVVYNRRLDTVIKRWPQRHPMTWFVQSKLGNSKAPLFLSEEIHSN